MRLFRFAAVWVAIIAVFMIFGGVFGYLFVSAFPQRFTVHGSASGGAHDQAQAEGPGAGGNVAVGAASDVPPGESGAKFFAAIGMLVGTGLGLCISILDQIILAFRRRREGKPGAGLAPTPMPVAMNSPPLRVDTGAVPR